MADSTLDLDLIEKKASSVYEAVLIIAKRARAITAERKSREALEERENTIEMEILDDQEREPDLSILPDEEKAVVIAMDDFFNDRLVVSYRTEN